MILRDRSFPETNDLSRAPTLDNSYVATCADAWSQTLSLLDKLCARPSDDEARRTPPSGRVHTRSARCTTDDAQERKHALAAKSAPAEITVLERLSSAMVVLRWCSCCCHYGEQLWIRQMARGSGFCAITGKPIQRGDPVFRPQNRGRTKPANVDAMIHASALD